MINLLENLFVLFHFGFIKIEATCVKKSVCGDFICFLGNIFHMVFAAGKVWQYQERN